jgi:hypothetical protein
VISASFGLFASTYQSFLPPFQRAPKFFAFSLSIYGTFKYTIADADFADDLADDSVVCERVDFGVGVGVKFSVTFSL